MAKINPFVLQNLRNTKRLSQERLADLARINTQTISRLERGKQRRTNEHTINRLAQVLKVEPEELTRDDPGTSVQNAEPARRASQSPFGISTVADNFLDLIADRYFIKPWQVMELAPLLFCWAAEMSLRARRERLDKLQEILATAGAIEAQMPHLPGSDFSFTEKWMAAEASSIDSQVIWGAHLYDDEFDSWHPDDYDNPFSTFLAKLADDISAVATFDGFSPLDYPSFRVCFEDAKRLVGGDEELADWILMGVVSLREMPKDIQEHYGTPEARAAWVRGRVEEHRQRRTGIANPEERAS